MYLFFFSKKKQPPDFFCVCSLSVVFSKGLLSYFFGPAPKVKQANLEQENEFYYDEEKKKWVIQVTKMSVKTNEQKKSAGEYGDGTERERETERERGRGRDFGEKLNLLFLQR